MKISLNQHELVKASLMYLNAQGFETEDKLCDVTFTAGRGERGIEAEVNIGDTQKSVDIVPEITVTESIEIEQVHAQEVAEETVAHEEVGANTQSIFDKSEEAVEAPPLSLGA